MMVSRAVVTTLIIAPISVMVILGAKVLVPALKDPETRIYYSGIGYPAMQRKLGKPIKVQTVSVAEKNLEVDVAAPGESVPLQQVDIRSQVSGAVEKVLVAEGQWVRRGQPLLQLQREPFENNVNIARNNLATAEKDLNNLLTTMPASLQNLKADVNAAQARLDNAKTRLQGIDNLAASEYNNNIATAEVRLNTAKEKLSRMQSLAKEGVISNFQLLEMQDVYATRKRELIAAKQGILNTETQRFSNQDFYITRQNELTTAKKTLQLAQENFSKELANLRLTLDNRRLELQAAQINLNRTAIYANIDGLVSKVNIHAGEIINTNSNNSQNSLMTLAQNTVFKAYIDQARLNAIQVGNKANVRLVAYPGKSFSGRVIQLNPTVQTDVIANNKVGTDRQFTYSVWVMVDNLKMSPGLQGYVQFEKGKRSLVIPENSVTHLSGGEAVVMVNSQGKAVLKKVKVGRTFDNQREVLAGLAPGEQVVIYPNALKSGDTVVTRDEEKNEAS